MLPGDTICYCKGIARGTIVQAIRAGGKTLQDIQAAPGACTGNRCKKLNPKGICCSADIYRILAEEGGSSGSGSAGRSDCDPNTL